MSIYGPDDDEEPAEKVRPTGLQGGSTRGSWPAWATDRARGGSADRLRIPNMGDRDASPYTRKPVPRHATIEGGPGRADATVVPASLVTEGERGGGPVYEFPEDPRNPSNYGARDRRLYDETVVWAAMHDPSIILPRYLGDWLYLRGERFGLEPPDWCLKRLHRLASYPNRHQQEAYRLYVWCGQLVAEMRRTAPAR